MINGIIMIMANLLTIIGNGIRAIQMTPTQSNVIMRVIVRMKIIYEQQAK